MMQATDTKRSQQQHIEKLQQATRRLSEAESPEEQQGWAQQIRTYAENIASTNSGRTALSVEAVVPSTKPLSELSRQVEEGRLRGVREITYRRDNDGQGRIRITATQEALTQASDVLSTFEDHVKRAFKSGE